MSQLLDTLELVEDWSARTNKILLQQMKRLKVGEKGAGNKELFFSLKSLVYVKTGQKIQMDLSFMDSGRYRDMGAGSTAKNKTESMEGNKRLATGRQPAKWYSKPFYGRLNALMGIVSAEITETVTEVIKESFGPQLAPKQRKK